MILSPAPLPDDDLELCSDILLSLETRDDITTRVLENTLADEIISNISLDQGVFNIACGAFRLGSNKKI